MTLTCRKLRWRGEGFPVPCLRRLCGGAAVLSGRSRRYHSRVFRGLGLNPCARNSSDFRNAQCAVAAAAAKSHLLMDSWVISCVCCGSRSVYFLLRAWLARPHGASHVLCCFYSAAILFALRQQLCRKGFRREPPKCTQQANHNCSAVADSSRRTLLPLPP